VSERGEGGGRAIVRDAQTRGRTKRARSRSARDAPGARGVHPRLGVEPGFLERLERDGHLRGPDEGAPEVARGKSA
jgi:hypothetical protein